jgi:hypothetical protein
VAEDQDAPPPQRAAFYIDGFNLYHTVREMAEPHLKWCDLWALSTLVCAPNGHSLVKVVFCTAMPLHKPASLARHQVFNQAQVMRNVEIVKGHYIWNDEIQNYSEKQSDINVALSLILDGIDDAYDWAYLVSADSDQAATARVFKERLPFKKLAVVAPPGRKPPDKAVPYADLHFAMKKEDIERTLLPQFILQSGGSIRRPSDYDPPNGWLAPDARPKRKR